MGPLNPLLFTKLEGYYGTGQVEIVNAGIANSSEVVWTLAADGNRRYPTRRMLQSGEEYLVRCKRCLDHRPRLYINHMWGVQDDETQSKNLWLAYCHNEGCYGTYEHQKWLYDIVYALGGGPRAQAIKPGRAVVPGKLTEMPWPGAVYRLDVLAKKMPGHDALKYLVGRDFDPIKLGKLWGVGYCSQSSYRKASNRIIIPVYYKGKLVGWQARYIGDNVDGVPFNKAGVPKYWTSPGFPKRLTAYNIERAVRHRTLVLVEGVADCWNTGLMSAALLGKTLSSAVLKQIVDGMAKHGTEGVVVVMLDPKADPNVIERKKPHHIERVVAQLFPAFGDRVVPVYLQEQYDPGSIDRNWMREIVRDEASKRGLRVSFSKPA